MAQALSDITVQSLNQLHAGQEWRLQLAHDQPAHLLLWVTRGQGRVLLDGMRRGVGAYNALWIPAGSLFALDLGRQGMGHAVQIPAGAPLRLPEMARHLRIRDAGQQAALSAQIEAAEREARYAAPLAQDAMEAHAALMSVWLRRLILQDDHVPAPRSAGARLSARFCAMVCARYTTGAPMAEYAAALEVTPTHLTRAVKAATGRTAAEILSERVVHAARSLLAETTQPAQQIAQHLGFGSAAYFTRFMQQHTGKVPSRLRG